MTAITFDTVKTAAREGRLFSFERFQEGQPRTGVARAMLIGAAIGLVYAIPYRLMMRLMSEEPTLTWQGTAAIFLVEAILGALCGLLYAGRQRGWSWKKRIAPAVPVLAYIAYLTLFVPSFPLIVWPLLLAGTCACWPATARWGLVGLAAVAYLAFWPLVAIVFPNSYYPVWLEIVVCFPFLTAMLAPVIWVASLAATPVRRDELREPAFATAAAALPAAA